MQNASDGRPGAVPPIRQNGRKSAAVSADQAGMSSCSAIGASDPASAMVAAQQAQISQQAALKAAKMVMEVQKDSGTRLIESLIKSANAQQAAAAEGSIDVLA